MSKEFLVEIRIIKGGDWQWTGKLTKSQLTLLCDIADIIADQEEE